MCKVIVLLYFVDPEEINFTSLNSCTEEAWSPTVFRINTFHMPEA